MKTGIIITDTYSNHNTGPGHPENSDRVSIVIENLKKLTNIYKSILENYFRT